MGALRQEVRYFLTAVMFFTRLPCPAWVDHDPTYLNRSRKYFSLVGCVVGAIAAGAYALAAQALPPAIAATLSTAAGVYVTGAFHEDGFADVCDGIGGGWTAARVLEIMRDSRVGAFGVVGAALLLLLKVQALAALGAAVGWPLTALSLVGAHAVSRFVATTFVYTHDYVRDDAGAKAKPVASERLGVGELAVGGAIAAVPLVLLPGWAPWAAVAVAYATKVWLGRLFVRNIGGYTGDCLGATQQVAEVAMYLTLLAVWS